MHQNWPQNFGAFLNNPQSSQAVVNKNKQDLVDTCQKALKTLKIHFFLYIFK